MCIRDSSYIGYITQEIQVGYQTSFKVVLKDDTKTLDEIIVVGYGSQQKGMWISKNELSSLTLLNETTGTSDGANGSMTEGYIYLFNDPIKEGKGWLEKYYLYQVPLATIHSLKNPDFQYFELHQ